MFEIGWTELLLIAVVAIVVIGPKDLPRAMRVVGQWTARMKRMARDFQGQFNEALKEAELDGVQKDLQSLSKIDPIGRVRKELSEIETSMKKELAPPAPATPTPAPVPVAESATPAVPSVPQPDEGPAVPQPPEVPKVASS
jgi:sec-independent protein translocase protein TatB